MQNSISATQLKETAQKIKSNPEATRALVAAARTGDQASAARILSSNGVTLPPHAAIEFQPGPVGIKPEDTCVEVTATHRQEADGKVTDTYRIRIYAG